MKIKNKILHSLGALSLLVTVFVLGSSQMAFAGDPGVKVGLLTCESIPGSGLNLIIHSTVDIKCQFKGVDGTVERYKGETGIGLGIDLKWKRDVKIAFTVFSAQFKPGTHQLAGSYAGASASATVGVGVGGHTLIGGSNKSMGLKPAVEESTGLAIAGGLGYMHLEAAN